LQRRNYRHGYERIADDGGLKSQVLTGKLSKAFIVRRIVLGCLSRDEGTRGGLRCAMSRGKEKGKGKGGRREREEEGGEEGKGMEGGGGRVSPADASEGFRGMEGPRRARSADSWAPLDIVFSFSACHLPC
jgi:hypothetical protein